MADIKRARSPEANGHDAAIVKRQRVEDGTLTEMLAVKVEIIPHTTTSRPVRFPMEYGKDARRVVDALCKRCGGPGSLWRLADGAEAYVDLAKPLYAGDYVFRVFPQVHFATKEGRPSGAFLSALHHFLVVERESSQDDTSSGMKAFCDATQAVANDAADDFGFTVVDGRKIQPLPKPTRGTSRCKSFPLGKFSHTDAARGDFVEYTIQNLKNMGIPMGEDGLNVLDVHHKKSLLAVCTLADEQWFGGGIDCAVVQHGVPEEEVACHIRVGFVYQQSKEDKGAVAARGSKGGSYKDLRTRPLDYLYPRMVMTMLAATAMNDAPVDLLVTDGLRFTLYRMRNFDLLLYRDLTAKQAFSAIAAALIKHDASAIQPHYTMKERLKPQGVNFNVLQAHTDSWAA